MAEQNGLAVDGPGGITSNNALRMTTHRQVLKQNREKLASHLRDTFGITGGVKWEDEPVAIRDRWLDEANEVMRVMGLIYDA